MSSVLSCCIFLDHSNICASSPTMAAAPIGEPTRAGPFTCTLIRSSRSLRTAERSPWRRASHLDMRSPPAPDGLHRTSPALPWVVVVAILAAQGDSQELCPLQTFGDCKNLDQAGRED